MDASASKCLVGTIGGGKAKPTGRVDIAVMQSLSRQGQVNALVENYGQVIVDECHHVGAASFDAILKRTKAKFVLGLTATPIRRDGQQPIIFMQCGPIRHSAAKPAGAPHDLAVLPRSRESRIDLPTTAGIQDVFRHLVYDLARTEAIAAHREARRRRFRSSSAGHLGTGDAGFLERHAAAVRGPPAPGTRQQDRCAHHRLRRHRPPGVAADVGQAAAGLSRDGVPSGSGGDRR